MVGRARTAEIAGRLAVVRDRIGRACAAAGRPPDDVTLVAVTKTYPADDVIRLAELGVLDVGENRDQDAAPKARAVAERDVPVRWHFVGHLQRNKCRSVVEYATVVHSVDSLRLATALGEAAERAGRSIGVLVQVSLDGDATRGGATDRTPGDRRTRVRCGRPRAQGRDGRGTHGLGPRPGVFPAAGGGHGVAEDAPGGGLDLGRDERRSRIGRQPRLDTCPCWHGIARKSTATAVA